ncbi:MAG: endonuclease domain-containing protein [Candidatus Marinimicrobia bacterium]|nr:endonuclease domain-containing protein [Candidatus Neomarinimicrobiota bacterium]MBT3634228.1 endonuclease domain-containing protein [Candidatus Neomarinimicrobiota bacterium]MBT3682973.1 endonuclease domain-containing protein [Candidatus Neomarinimicrobiota bacterium]MBT3760037.1 endonuclease domain-containing protein [Candidatus Neomarinimicrobiota bacterium]MBT3896196.1 endonuclease domain-containing protein [Candidatus Neomarinimicrobiota bacterium]
MFYYNNNLTELARENRKNQTEAEKRLWIEVLRNKKMDGYKFTRQKPIENYILDFYCSKLKLGIEVDGSSHDGWKDYDDDRTLHLSLLGIEILRYQNYQVLNEINYVNTMIRMFIVQRKIELDD